MTRDETDETLMLAYQGGDARAFEVLLNRHKRPVFNFIFRFVGDRTVAEDLLQDVFLRSIRGAERYQKQAKFTTWLYTIARNLCVDHSRRQKHRRVYSLDTPMDRTPQGGATLLDVVSDKAPGTDRTAESQRMHTRLQGAIDELSAEQREVFVMREFLDMRFKDIADVVGCPENTVKSRMRYALDKLRASLGEYAEVAKVMP